MWVTQAEDVRSCALPPTGGARSARFSQSLLELTFHCNVKLEHRRHRWQHGSPGIDEYRKFSGIDSPDAQDLGGSQAQSRLRNRKTEGSVFDGGFWGVKFLIDHVRRSEGPWGWTNTSNNSSPCTLYLANRVAVRMMDRR